MTGGSGGSLDALAAALTKWLGGPGSAGFQPVASSGDLQVTEQKSSGGDTLAAVPQTSSGDTPVAVR